MGRNIKDKKMIKIINIIFIVIIMYLLIGNLYRGITSPTLIGNPKGHFLGYYFITVAYFVLLILNNSFHVKWDGDF